ncbi:MAG: EamA family transporter [Chloroflexaceae bacterium]|nr:EamA family transporter [Chloroflexaceae bacterium]
MSRPNATLSSARNAPWLWLSVALIGHTSWSLYPVLARYLQTVSNLPPLALLAAANGAVLLVLGRYLWQRTDHNIWRSQVLWLFVLAVGLRGITNVLSARLTLAIYVQLAALATPFMVAFLGRWLFEERIPRFTISAVSISVVGALLMMSGDANLSGGLALALSMQDVFGIVLALLSSLFLAFYMLLLRRSAQRALSGEGMLLVQLAALVIISGGLSLLFRENWGSWLVLGGSDWLAFAGLALGPFLIGNVSQISALRQLGAPFVSSMFGWRLVATVLFAALMLGERLTTIWQVGGALLVVVTVSLYLWYNATHPDLA